MKDELSHPDITVERIQTDSGSHVEPPLDQSWSDLQKLQWHAAVTEVDCGVKATVQPAKYWINHIPQHGYYSIQVASSSISALSFQSAWDYLNGIELGARAVRESGMMNEGDE